jgi:hypothetical protein
MTTRQERAAAGGVAVVFLRLDMLLLLAKYRHDGGNLWLNMVLILTSMFATPALCSTVPNTCQLEGAILA